MYESYFFFSLYNVPEIIIWNIQFVISTFLADKRDCLKVQSNLQSSYEISEIEFESLVPMKSPPLESNTQFSTCRRFLILHYCKQCHPVYVWLFPKEDVNTDTGQESTVHSEGIASPHVGAGVIIASAASVYCLLAMRKAMC